MAEWQSGYAADCNSVNIGSIPFSASNLKLLIKIFLKHLIPNELKIKKLKINKSRYM